MKNLPIILLVVACFAIAILATDRPKERVSVERHTDTLVVRDTVQIIIEMPTRAYISRIDTVWLESPIDSTQVPVIIPIERKEYDGEEYRAVIEGYRANIISMEVYPLTKYITNTEIKTITKRHRWGVGIQVGYGFTPSKIEPYIGIGLSYNLWSW